MFLLVILLSIWIFIRTFSYAIFEIKQNQNKFGAVSVIIIAIIGLVLPIIAIII